MMEVEALNSPNCGCNMDYISYLAQYLVELALPHTQLLACRPSLIGAAATYLSMIITWQERRE